MMMIMTILMMVVFFNVVGLLFRIGWGIMRIVFGFVGFLMVAGIVLTLAGVYFLPVIAVIALIAAGVKGLRRL